MMRAGGAVGLVVVVLAGCFVDKGGGVSGSEAASDAGDSVGTAGAGSTTEVAEPTSGGTCAGGCATATSGSSLEAGATETDGEATETGGGSTTGGVGTATFSRVDVALIGGAAVLAAGDLDGDGVEDLVMQGATDEVLYIVRGAAVDSLEGAPYPLSRGIATMDVDGDGVAEILMVMPKGEARVEVLRAKGGIEVVMAVALGECVTFGDVVVADVDQDTVDDLVIGCAKPALMVLRGKKDGFVEAVTIDAGVQSARLAVADVVGASFPDAIVVDAKDERVAVLRGAVDLGFGVNQADFVGVTAPVGVAAGDVDGDGRGDFVAVAADGACHVVLGKPDGLSVGAKHACGGDARDVRVVDLDADGRMDLVVSGTDALQISVGVGDGTFMAPVAYKVGQQAGRLAIGDFNGDGWLDIAVATGSGVSIYMQDE